MYNAVHMNDGCALVQLCAHKLVHSTTVTIAGSRASNKGMTYTIQTLATFQCFWCAATCMLTEYLIQNAPILIRTFCELYAFTGAK